MAVERLARVGGQRGQRNHGGDDDVAQFGLNVFPGVGDALARVLAERPDNGLGDFANAASSRLIAIVRPLGSLEYGVAVPL